jgi:carbon starvation protein CstA
LFAVSIVLTQIDFNLLWRYFSWANQSTAVITLFIAAMYLYVSKKNYWVALLPGTFMLYTVLVYILNAQIGFRLPMNISYIISAVISIILVVSFFIAARKARANELQVDLDVTEITEVA